MGNDLTVFQEGELEESFYKHHGPANESWRDFFSRTFSGMMNMLMQPKRCNYCHSDLLMYCDDELVYQPHEYSIVNSSHQLLHCATWIENPLSKLWIIYLHTNTRALVDAQEILPLCQELGANLLSFDLPGCGKSEGNLSFSMVSDLAVVLRHLWQTHPNIEIVVWARGMSTALILEYLQSPPSIDEDETIERTILSSIRYLILDSPFISVSQMVNDASRTITAYGVSVPSPIITFCSSLIRRNVKSKLGSDPYDVIPINSVPFMTLPCYILSARHDDYMPPHHGQAVYESWGSNYRELTPRTSTSQPECQYEIFEGKHFGFREKEIVLKPLESIREYVSYRPLGIEQQLSSSTCGGEGGGGNRLMFPSTIFRIPSASSLASKGCL
jgi:pimeloyl-ACP methyl ester carboxylesterase